MHKTRVTIYLCLSPESQSFGTPLAEYSQ